MKRILTILFSILLFSTSYTNAQKGYPCDIELSKKAVKLMADAKKAQDKGENDKATALFKQCIAEQDDWAEPYYRLGMQAVRKLERSNDKTENLCQTAINYFEKTIERCPEFKLDAYLHLGKLNYNIGQYAQAVKYLEIFMEDPDKITTRQYEDADLFLTYSKEYEKLYGSPVAFDPKPVPGMSTSDDEYLGRISPDEEYMFYTRRKIITQKVYDQKKTIIKEVFSVSERQNDNSFSVGDAMPSPPFNMTENEGSPTITLDNNYMVFTRCANIPVAGTSGTYYNCDLYYTERINGEWTPIKNLGAAINREDSWEAQASISPDGRTLFFASNRPGGHGENDIDIYYSIRDANGKWQKAVNAGNVINSEGNEKSPFIHSDGKTLYFSSNGHVGLGGYDVYFSRLSEKGTWQKPQNLGYPINTEGDEVGFFVNTLGDKAYFSTNTISGNFDICYFDLYEEARPQKVLLLKGIINNLNEEEEQIDDDGNVIKKPAKVELKNIATKQITTVNVDEQSGKFAAIINDMDNDYLMTIKKEDYAYEAKYISPKSINSGESAAMDDINFTMKSIESGKSYKINDIYYATNSSELTDASKIVLDVLIDFLNDNPNISIEIQGHTDNIGRYQDNLVLSESRAKSVYNYLIQNYIQANRLTYKGYADSKPVADNNTEEGRSQNRRTVFVITKK